MRPAETVDQGKAAFDQLQLLLQTAPDEGDLHGLAVHMLLIDALLQSFPQVDFPGMPSFRAYADQQWTTLSGVAEDVDRRTHRLGPGAAGEMEQEAAARWLSIRRELPWLDHWASLQPRIGCFSQDPKQDADEADRASAPRLDHEWIDRQAPLLSADELEQATRVLQATGAGAADLMQATMPLLLDKADDATVQTVTAGLKASQMLDRDVALLAPRAVTARSDPVRLAYESVRSIDVRRRLDPGSVEVATAQDLTMRLAGYADQSTVPFATDHPRFWADQVARGLEQWALGRPEPAHVHFRRAACAARPGFSYAYAGVLAGLALCASGRDEALTLLSHMDLDEPMDWHGALEEVDRWFELTVRIGVSESLTVEVPFSARAGAWAIAGCAIRKLQWGLACSALAAIAQESFEDRDLAERALGDVPITPASVAALVEAVDASRVTHQWKQLSFERLRSGCRTSDWPGEDLARALTVLGIGSNGWAEVEAVELVGALPTLELQRSVLEGMSDAARRGSLGSQPTVEALLDRVEAGELLTFDEGASPADVEEQAVDGDIETIRERLAAGELESVIELLATSRDQAGWDVVRDEVFLALSEREDWPGLFAVAKRIGYQTLTGRSRLVYASALAAVGQHDAAIEVLGQAVTMGDFAREARIQRVRMLLGLGRRGQARRDLNQLVIEDPTDAVVLGLSAELESAGPTERRSIPREVKDRVWQRDQGRCAECGSQVLLEFDHIIPLAMGGSNTERNLQLLCEDCNRAKAANL